jgi:hypothetical protein
MENRGRIHLRPLPITGEDVTHEVEGGEAVGVVALEGAGALCIRQVDGAPRIRRTFRALRTSLGADFGELTYVGSFVVGPHVYHAVEVGEAETVTPA